MKSLTSTLIMIALAAAISGCSSSPDLRPQAEAMFERQDRNNDGAISKEELRMIQNQRFKSADSNDDGYLSTVEFDSAVNEMVGSRSSRGRKGQGVTFAALDRNSDGRINANEYALRAMRMFDRQDLNQDGRVTKSEFAENLQKQSRRG